MSKRLLCQLQLSNYNTEGKFLLECDSGFQMCMGRVREMLKLDPDLRIDILGPQRTQLFTQPEEIYPELFVSGQANYVSIYIPANALQTRYEFRMDEVAESLGLHNHKSDKSLRYDVVYVNDPMWLTKLKAMFLLRGGYQPFFAVHSHFVDSAASPKFPIEASLWLGQVEAALKADWNFWQCESALQEFYVEVSKTLKPELVDQIMAKSISWDDGYSHSEITSRIVDPQALRFDTSEFDRLVKGKLVLFYPNRIGGRGRSSDYTAGGKLLFELLPKLRKLRQDYVLIAGNPSQKFSNAELEAECGPNGFVSLVPDALRRDEFKWICRRADVSLGTYPITGSDTYGGTAARECVALGTAPFWMDCNEYASLADSCQPPWPYRSSNDFSNFVEKLSQLMDDISNPELTQRMFELKLSLQTEVKNRCSYESTTSRMMKKMNL